jgi:hypothetical protein
LQTKDQAGYVACTDSQEEEGEEADSNEHDEPVDNSPKREN